MVGGNVVSHGVVVCSSFLVLLQIVLFLSVSPDEVVGVRVIYVAEAEVVLNGVSSVSSGSDVVSWSI